MNISRPAPRWWAHRPLRRAAAAARGTVAIYRGRAAAAATEAIAWAKTTPARFAAAAANLVPFALLIGDLLTLLLGSLARRGFRT